jgi:hypothetical protein
MRLPVRPIGEPSLMAGVALLAAGFVLMVFFAAAVATTPAMPLARAAAPSGSSSPAVLSIAHITIAGESK